MIYNLIQTFKLTLYAEIPFNFFTKVFEGIHISNVTVIKKKQKLNSTSSFIKARSFIKYNKQSFQEDIRYHPK